ESVGADHWLVTAGIEGPLASVAVMPMDVADKARNLPGVVRADPIVMLRQSMHIEGRSAPEDIVLFGVVSDGLGVPGLVSGRGVAATGEAVIDDWSGLRTTDVVTVGTGAFTIVGTTTGRTIAGGLPTLYASVEDVQDAVFQGAPFIQAVALQGTPDALPDGYRLLSPTAVVDDVMRPMQRLTYSLNLISILLWAAAAAVVGSIIYLTAVERTRDFAALRAIGVGRRALLAGLAVQGILVTAIAALLSFGIAIAMMPMFPTPLTLTGSAVILLVPVAVLVGVLASAASIHRVLSTDPALAFASA
ncbi:MAG TPA: ABC transporter permease, partial [Nitriliruptorales bacterium]